MQVIQCELQEDKEEKRHYSTCVRSVRQPRGTLSRSRLLPCIPVTMHLPQSPLRFSFEVLPDQDDSNRPNPLGGRKLLAFSDNRQDAAFFAPFFERTSLDLALRACIAEAIREDGAATLRQVRDRVWRLLGSNGRAAYKAHHGMADDMGDSDSKERLFAQIIAEFFTPGLVRVSLEGLGIASIEYDPRSLNGLVEEIWSCRCRSDPRRSQGLRGTDARPDS